MQKIFLAFICSIFLCTYIYAQTGSQMGGNNYASIPYTTSEGLSSMSVKVGMGGNYFQKENIENNNDVGLPHYTSNGSDPEAYFSKDWAQGSITTLDHNTYDSGLLFMYDKINNNLYFRKQDSSTVMQVDQGRILSFSLITDKQHTFIKSDLISGADKGKFFEILLLNENKYSFFKSVKRVYDRPSPTTASMALTQTESEGHYEDKTAYYLYNNGVLKEVELKRKDFLNALDVDRDKIEAYMKAHNGNFNEIYVVKMLLDLN